MCDMQEIISPTWQMPSPMLKTLSPTQEIISPTQKIISATWRYKSYVGLTKLPGQKLKHGERVLNIERQKYQIWRVFVRKPFRLRVYVTFGFFQEYVLAMLTSPVRTAALIFSPPPSLSPFLTKVCVTPRSRRSFVCGCLCQATALYQTECCVTWRKSWYVSIFFFFFFFACIVISWLY